jgi:hypothetical protein
MCFWYYRSPCVTNLINKGRVPVRDSTSEAKYLNLINTVVKVFIFYFFETWKLDVAFQHAQVPVMWSVYVHDSISFFFGVIPKYITL